MINYSRRLIVCIIVVDNHCCPPSPDDQFWQNAEKHFHSKNDLFRVTLKLMIMPRQCCIAIISHPRAVLLNVQQMVQIQLINVIVLNLRFFSIMPLIDGDWCVVGSVGLGGPCWWALGFSCYLRSSGGLVSIVPLYSPAAATMCKSQYFNNELIKHRMY